MILLDPLLHKDDRIATMRIESDKPSPSTTEALERSSSIVEGEVLGEVGSADNVESSQCVPL
jgi:hypothetical protein